MKPSDKRKPDVYAALRGSVQEVNTSLLSLEELEKILQSQGSVALTYYQVLAGIELVKLEKPKHEKGSFEYVKYSVMELILSDRKLRIIIELQKIRKYLHEAL